MPDAPPELLLKRIEERMDELSSQLSRLERLTHGGRGVYVGNNRMLVKISIEEATFVFLVEADDRLIVPRFFADGSYEPELTRFFINNVRTDDHCLDVGANFGYYTAIMARSAIGGKTLGLEPDQKVFELLRDNIYINHLEAAAIPMHAAAANEEGMMTLHRRLTRSGNTSIIEEPFDKISRLGEDASQPFAIRCVPIDALLGDFGGRIDYTKIDVEGAEPLVFQGMRQTIRNNPKINIVMEWAPNQIRGAGFDVAQFTADLASMGLAGAVIGEHSSAPIGWDRLLGIPYLSGILLTSTS
jgi:FkbM family methyltransferase